MPVKIRQLITQLKQSGFKDRGGKGSHRKFKHPEGAIVVISGSPGSDAKPYQLRDVQRALESIAHEKK